ncbi:MAG: helix-turn-helix domain-containing protein [Myxococcota bacterium]
MGGVERDAIVRALADSNHNQTHAARRLGVSRRALIYKMEKYGLKRPPKSAREK